MPYRLIPLIHELQTAVLVHKERPRRCSVLVYKYVYDLNALLITVCIKFWSSTETENIRQARNTHHMAIYIYAHVYIIIRRISYHSRQFSLFNNPLKKIQVLVYKLLLQKQ